MNYVAYTQKLNSLNYYIESCSAVTIDALIPKLEVSRRTVLRMVETLRANGVDIKYCKKRKRYFI